MKNHIAILIGALALCSCEDYLTQENEGLKEKVNSEKSIQKQMEVLMLKKENEQLRRFVQRIPPEVRQALKEQQQGRRRDKDRQR